MTTTVSNASNQVKFNYGPLSTLPLGESHAYDLSFLARDSSLSTAKDFGYIYFGDKMVATKYLKYLDVALDYYQGVNPDTHDLIVNLTYDTSQNKGLVGNGKRLLTYTGDLANYTGATDQDIFSARLTLAAISEQIEENSQYHTTGGFAQTVGGTAEPWYKYRAKYWFGGTEIQPGTTGYKELTFELPVVTSTSGTGGGNGFSASDDTHLPTSKSIADYFSGLAGGMRYCGSISSGTLPTNNPYYPFKPGDVFIASTGFTVGTDPKMEVDNGDMVVLNSYYSSGNLAYVNSNWNFDLFERNLDGSVTTSVTLDVKKLIVGGGDKTIETLTTTAGGLVYSSAANTVANLAIGDAGQILKVVSSKPTWSDYYYEMVTNGTSGDDSFTVTPYTNGTAGTATTITIDDVNKAKSVKHTSDTSTNGDIPLLLAGATSPTNNSYYAVKYSGVKYNPYTLTISGAKEMTLTQNNVSVNVYDGLIWHTLATS